MVRRPRNAEAVMIEMDSQDRNVSRPGAFYFVRRAGVSGFAGIIHGCPCGCGGRSLLYLSGGSTSGRNEHAVVEGEWPKVTLSPSIGIKYDVNGRPGKDGGYHWHGYLRSGVFVEEPVNPEET